MKQNVKVILASASPRRRELLGNIGIEFECASPTVCELPLEDNKGEEIVCYNALAKAKSLKKDGYAVIGADTAVYLDGKGFGKPANETMAYEFLKELSGKVHYVYTGVAVVVDEKEIVKSVSTKVKFRTLNDKEIWHYIKSKYPLDKAGAYGIQDFGGVFVEEIVGDYFNVVGLPIGELYKMLLESNVIEYNL